MEKIIDEKFYDFIIDGNLVTLDNTGFVTPFTDRHSIIHATSADAQMCDLGHQPYHRFPTLYTLSSQLDQDTSVIPHIQDEPSLALSGFGVVVAVIDTGIDYQHPVFLHKDGTSRILAIWDQTLHDGVPPEGFKFGSEYSKDLIDLALQTDAPHVIVPSVDTNGHGTAIASIAAGNANKEKNVTGVAPDAKLIIVKLKGAKRNLRRLFNVPEGAVCYQETDVIFGMKYALETAKRLSRPLVICLALSSNMGGHEAFGPASIYMDYLTQLSRVAISVSGGNEGNKQRHYFGMAEDAPFVNEFELKISKNDPNFSFELWPDIHARISIQIISPKGEKSPVILPSIDECVNYQFIFGEESIWVNNVLFEKLNATQMILVRFSNAAEGIWGIRIVNLDENTFSFNCWLPSGQLISNETYFIPSDPDTTITAPGNTGPALTATAYDQYSNNIISAASRGYTRLGRVKPDIAAPGSRIPCAVPHNEYSVLTGTGAAAAHVAGVISMVLEWAVIRGNYTSITGNDISSLVIQSAARSAQYTYPNKIWGYGRLDIKALFDYLDFIS
jgi:subtilisin family serine protease